MFFLWILLQAYQRVSNTEERMIQLLILYINSQRCISGYFIAQIWQKKTLYKRSHEELCNCIIIFSHNIWLLIIFHLLVMGKPDVILPHWITTKNSVLPLNWLINWETKEGSEIISLKLRLLLMRWLEIISLYAIWICLQCFSLLLPW